MKIQEILKEVFNVNLFKRNMQNAISSITSEMQNVQANMAEKDEAIKQKDNENEQLQQKLRALSGKVNAIPEPSQTKAAISSSGVGTAKTLPQEV